jgi:hypothetical protein
MVIPFPGQDLRRTIVADLMGRFLWTAEDIASMDWDELVMWHGVASAINSAGKPPETGSPISNGWPR